MLGHATFDTRHHQVLEPDVGEGTAHHHFVIATARAVGIEVDRLHAVGDKVLTCRAVLFDIAGRRDVIGGDRIAKLGQCARIHQRLNGTGGARHVDEVGWVLDVGRTVVPAVAVGLGNFNTSPARVARIDIGVARAEHLGVDGAGNGLGYFGGRWPDVLQVNVLAILALT